MTRRRPALVLFLFFFSLYALTASGNAFRVPDEFEVYFQAEHLADAGDISVPQTLAITQNGEPIFYGKFGRDRRPYAPYGPAVAYLILPFHLLGRAVAAAAGVPRLPLPAGVAWEFLVGGVTSLAMAFAAALAVAGFARAAGLLTGDPRRVLGLSLLLGGATYLWVYGTTLYSESWLAAAFAWAAAFLIDARRRGGAAGRTMVVAAAALVTAAGLTKPTALVIAPGFVIVALLDGTIRPRLRLQVAGALAGAIGLAAATQIAWNLQRFGAPLDFGYNLAAMVPSGTPRAFAPAEIPRGLVVQLFSPGKALIVWAPPLLLAALSFTTAWRRERGMAIGLVAATAAALVFYAAFLYPEGGYAHGPRHLLPLVPLWMLAAALPPRLPRALVVACAAAGVVICVLAVSVSFLEDQSPPSAGMRTGPYYERVQPPPGRPWNRYRLDYLPFRTALGSGHWLDSRRPPGNGPDFFALHLARARRLLPGGVAIPAALPWIAWLVPLAGLLLTAPLLLGSWSRPAGESRR
jgi:hypothetical protein